MHQITLKKKKLNFQAREAFKMLRTNIEFSGENKKVIAVSSCVPNEGKSTIAYQLAFSFAEKGKKTLLIDADLRKSVMQKVSASGTVKVGLTNYLTGKEKLMDVLVGTDEPNFFVIFAGHVPPNPSELLGSDRFEMLLEAAKKTFDMVIVDTPPVSSVIDGVVVASRADGVVLVLRQGSVSYQMARRVKEQLLTSGGNVIGVVLNEVDHKDGGYYGRYYGRYYGKRYSRYGYGAYYGIKPDGGAENTEAEASSDVGSNDFVLK